MRRRRNKAEANVAVCVDDRNASFVFAVAAAMLLTTTLVVPTFAVLPVLASVALACAAVVALAARWPAFQGNRLLLSDLAGAFALVGVAAAIFSGPTQIVETFAFLVP